MKKNKVLLLISIVLIHICFSIDCAHARDNQLDSSNEVKENFATFLNDFSKLNKFQNMRVKFPAIICSVYPNGDSSCKEIDEQKWEHIAILKEPIINYIYNDFNNLNIEDTDQRVFVINGIENSFGSYYYFIREEGRWYLLKVVNYE